MGLFGGGNSSSSTDNFNIGTDANLDNNQGVVNYGDGDVVTTDHGSVQSSIAGNTAVSQAALLANNEAVKAALAANEAVSSDAFDFGSKSLDLGSYAIEQNSLFASEILANGASATKRALEFAKDTNRSDSMAQTELMIKAVSVLGIVAVLAFAFGGKK